MKILIKNGRVIDPVNKIDDIRDILIDNDKISQVAKNIDLKADKIIDAKDKIVMPGLVDMHVHLREPGREDEETIFSGTKAALKGGITSILAMPNTSPVIDSVENIKLLKAIIDKTTQANVYITAAITIGQLGKEPTNLDALKKEGAFAITDDGSSVDDEQIMLAALKNAKQNKLLVICHCEDKSLSNNGVANNGYISTILGLRGIPKEAEFKRVERDIKLAQDADAAVHITHVSCQESVEIIAKAKKKGIKVTADVTPHHLSLDEEELVTFDTNLKMNPPLRTRQDVKALREALKSGTIDCIASDHAPHSKPEKEVEFDSASFGTTGLETSLSVAITELVETKILNWSQLVERMSFLPAEILGIDKGTLSCGSNADIVIIDPAKEWLVIEEDFLSQSHNSAFLGRKLKGVVEHTILRGKIVYTRK